MSERHERVVSLIQELTATFIQHEANTDPLITITGANTSPDYKRVTIFFTTIPDGKEDAAAIFLQRSAGALRQFIKKKTNLKIIPHIDFALDTGERHRQHIDEIVRETGTESTHEELNKKQD